jgi:primosomal protein N' (replication factor Y)
MPQADQLQLIVDLLCENNGSLELAALKRQVKGPGLTASLAALRRKGVVTRSFHLVRPEAKESLTRRLELALPREKAEERYVELESGRAKAQTKILRLLLDSPVPIKIPTGGAAAAGALVDKGVASIILVKERRNPYLKGAEEPTIARALTETQQVSVEHIVRQIREEKGTCTLLYGVTGSGKTEVYLQAAAEALKRGRGAIIALPEIGLTAQLLDLFKGRFGDSTVAVLHSALSPGERYDEWIRIKTGESRVVLGARSAVFAPVQNLGLLVLDEEHDQSYKQDVPPRYHARDVALKRAMQTGAPVVLGSATPSMESFYNAEMGTYQLVKMPERIDNRPLPPVVVVDLKDEFKNQPKRRDPNETESASTRMFSSVLRDAIAERIERREQTILFLNRRGFSQFLLCRDCGFSFRCPNCDISLTYHLSERVVRCHHCDHSEPASGECPKCHGLKLKPFGLGTEKVEEAVAELFPTARILRMDRDTMSRKGAHTEALRMFKRGDADILIGTQMVAKGLDFPNVTLVGVVSADTALNIPNFRTAERAFQLLTQVAGRAGRGTRPGLVIVQTFTPGHPSIVKASEHDYDAFYKEEIQNRKEIGYPPFRHMAEFLFSDEEADLAWRRCLGLAHRINLAIERQTSAMEVLGPAPCAIERLRGRVRCHFILRGENKEALIEICNAALTSAPPRDLIGFSLDIDPFTML